MKFLTASVAVLAILFVGTAAPAQAGLVLASNLSASPSYSSFDEGIGFAGSTSNGVFTNETPAQEFTAVNGGVITTIIATVGQFQPGGVPLTVTVSSAAGSTPGAALGSATFTTGQVSSNAFNSPTTFDLSAAHIGLVAGSHYFVTFSVATPIGGSIRYQALLLNTPNPIAFGFPASDSKDSGATWFSPTIPNEIGLTVNGQTAIPEPSSLVIALSLFGAFGLVRLRRRSLLRSE